MGALLSRSGNRMGRAAVQMVWACSWACWGQRDGRRRHDLVPGRRTGRPAQSSGAGPVMADSPAALPQRVRRLHVARALLGAGAAAAVFAVLGLAGLVAPGSGRADPVTTA